MAGRNRVTGGRQVAARMRKVKRELPAMMATALTAAAMPLQNQIKRNAPVLTGTLRRSYHTETIERNPPVVAVGTDVEYAPFVEYGTSRMAAQPHVRPAIDATRAAVSRTFARVLAALIVKAAGR